MNILQAIVLGLLQGATEFIPVSSSGHLELVPWILGWDAPGLTFIVVVHIGTAAGVLLYFRKDWYNIFKGTFTWLKTRDNSDSNFRLLLLIILGCVPAGLVGYLFDDWFEQIFEKPQIAAFMLLVTAAILFAGEKLGKLDRDTADMTWRDSLFIGTAQVLAIMPGISRSGSTIAAARLLNFKREDAARFSFLLATPLIIAAGVLQAYKLAEQGTSIDSILPLLVGFVTAFGSSYLVIHWLLGYLRTRSTSIFAFYCIGASLISIAVLLIRGT